MINTSIGNKQVQAHQCVLIGSCLTSTCTGNCQWWSTPCIRSVTWWASRLIWGTPFQGCAQAIHLHCKWLQSTPATTQRIAVEDLSSFHPTSHLACHQVQTLQAFIPMADAIHVKPALHNKHQQPIPGLFNTALINDETGMGLGINSESECLCLCATHSYSE